jgi:hypothetical protein
MTGSASCRVLFVVPQHTVHIIEPSETVEAKAARISKPYEAARADIPHLRVISVGCRGVGNDVRPARHRFQVRERTIRSILLARP